MDHFYKKTATVVAPIKYSQTPRAFYTNASNDCVVEICWLVFCAGVSWFISNQKASHLHSWHGMLIALGPSLGCRYALELDKGFMAQYSVAKHRLPIIKIPKCMLIKSENSFCFTDILFDLSDVNKLNDGQRCCPVIQEKFEKGRCLVFR